MSDAIEALVKEAAETVIHDTFPSMDVECALRYTEQATRTLRSLAAKVREQTLEDAAKLMCLHCKAGREAKITAPGVWSHEVDDGLQARGAAYRLVKCGAIAIRRKITQVKGE